MSPRPPRSHEGPERPAEQLELGMRPPALADEEARRRIAEDLGATLFVEAAAGTGKTSALVGRIVALLRSGAGTLERVVAVTFTEKAAGELKLRVRERIEQARLQAGTPEPERARLDTALEQLELAHIGTIHAFCGDLLHERPVEAGVDPLFEVAPEDEAARLLDRAFDAWFEAALADPPEGVRRVLRRRARGPNALGPREALRRAAESLIEHRDFPAAWQRPSFAREAEIDAVLEVLAELAALAGAASSPRSRLAQSFQEIERFVEETRLREGVRGRDYDGLEADLRALARLRSWTYKGYGKHYGKGLERDDVLARREAAKARLDAMLSACEADLAALLREELRPVVTAFEAAKQRAGKLDFLDLLVRARDLVRDDGGVRRELQERFTHYFVDEFQDTDPLQAEILLLLASDDPDQTDWRRVRPRPGKLFLVGDPKQSIYRFRRADVAIYEATKRQLAQRGAAVLHLSTSFRAVPSLQTAVNAAFAPRMGGGAGEVAHWEQGQPEYVPLEPSRPETEGQPSLVVLPTPRPYGDYGKMVRWRVEQSLPDAAGAFVDWLVHKSGWTVTEGRTPGKRIPVEPRHVCLLFRRFKSWGQDVTRPYVRALEARRIAHVLVGGRSFHDREEVLAIRNALCAIEWPDDELRVFATLRGPLFALGDDALLAFRHRMHSLHPLLPQDEDALGKLDAPEREVAEALRVLAGLHAARNHRPIAETLSRLLAAVRAHAGIAIWPTGEQALANCLRSIDLARRFERRGAPSFRAFVEHLETEAQRGEAEDAPVVEEGTEGVRIMTVHRAKGLEFPVVVLADPTANRVGRDPSRHVDPERGLWAEPICGCVPQDLLDAREEELRRDEEESIRLTYVAATRARDLLVLPGVGDARAEDDVVAGWLDVLHPTVYPAEHARRRGGRGPGCPPFGVDSVFERPGNTEASAEDSVRPGLHAPEAGTHAVVWWDPAVLELDREEEVGLRQERVLAADESGSVAEQGVRAHAGWQALRASTLEQGAQPWLRVATVTALAAGAEGPGAPPGGELAVEVLEVEPGRGPRPGGKRFGTLVHAVLAAADLESDPEGLDGVTRTQGRLVGATDEEVEAATAAARAALAHPILRRAAASGALRRETPVLLRLDDGSLMEGVVDLAFREEERAAGVWTVVDFKTDREIEGRRAVYEAQVCLYARAVAAATGESTRGLLLIV